MEYRNARWAVEGCIDCEINHPVYGWIPFTANVNDRGAAFDVVALHAQMAADPNTLPFDPALYPQPVPHSITRRQCARQLLVMGMITGPEAVAMTKTGEPPAAIAAYLATLPEEQRFLAEIDFAADSYLRNNPLLAALAAANGMSEADIDQFFRDAEQL